MGAIKRKAEQGSTPSKKDKGASNDRHAKRRKSDVTEQPASTKPAPEVKAQKSVFKDEEKSFPRGGASVLTPLEHKQIQIQANQDVLFEQAGTKRGGDDGLSDMGSDDGEKAAAKSSSKKRPAKKGKKAHEDADQEPTIKVEGLNYKKLTPGTIILGQITDVSHQDIVLALPNNLVGYVPLTSVSDKLNERLEQLLKEDEREDADDDEGEGFEDVHLEDMFTVGQYLRACVTATTDDSARARKRLELSIDPKMVNKGLHKRKIPVNSMVQASVVSNEDHGLVMDLGLDDSKTKGFLPKGELGKIQHAKVQEGTVFMCLVTGLNSDSRIVKLSADQSKAGNLTKGNTLTEAPTIDVFLPGTAVDVLIADTTAHTITGKILGLIDATADAYHSGVTEKGADVSQKYKIGSKVKGRILFTCPDSEPSKVGVSFLEHVVALSSRMSGKPKERKPPSDLLPTATIVENAKVVKVAPALGAFFELGVRDVIGFAHISRLSDDRVDILSEDAGAFKLASTHRARIVGYNALDGLFQLSLEQKVLDQPFLRIEDIKAGQVVRGKVHKLIADKKGATAVLVHLSEGITGLVSEMHLADVRLQHPERKFREGVPVTARVLYTEPARHQIQLTLKKSLVNSDVEPWTNYSKISEGSKGPGLLVNVQRSGAKVRFYGDITAWLPVAEMSEAFMDDATRHFAKGQVVNVRVISVNPQERQMLVSCKDPSALDPNKEAAFNALNPGDITKGSVLEKSDESATLDLGYGVKGLLRLGHLTDGSEKKDASTMKKIRVGGTLDDLVVLNKFSRAKTVTISNKPSLRKAAQASKLVTNTEELQSGEIVDGFVRGILPDKVFVEFGNSVSGALFKSQMTEEMVLAPNFGLRKDQSISARVTHVDPTKGLFWLSMKLEPDADEAVVSKSTTITGAALVKPVDSSITNTSDIQFGTTLTVRVRSVKSTQVNVELAENVQGRIHVSELFDSWDAIPDKKKPMSHFKMNENIKARILGRHDARNHRFLPITHRSSNKTPTYEMTQKMDQINSEADVLALDKIAQGSSHVAFVNNIADRYVWVNLSANVRGRIDFFDLTDDLEQLSDVEGNFPVGSALKVRVKLVDVAAGRLDLTAASTVTGKSLTLGDLKVGYILPARVTKLHDASIVAQINEKIAAPIYLEQLADDYDKAKPSEFQVGSVLRVCVTEVDLPNKRLGLSARPSKVLSSSLPVKDRIVQSKLELKVNEVVRGFVKKVADNGLFVRLGPHVEAYVRVSHLSDSYIKDWKTAFHVDQLVTGKIISNKDNMRNAQMSLKTSVIQGDYAESLEFGDFKAGQVVTAKVRHVTDYGVFLVVDNSNNVSGLCHVSRLADTPVSKDKIKAMYKADDVVKAKIVSINPKARKVNFSLKYSDIKGKSDEDEDMEDASDLEAAVDTDSDEEHFGVDDDVDMRSVKSAESEDEAVSEEEEEDIESDEEAAKATASGLTTSGFDWTGATLDFDEIERAPGSDSDGATTKKKRKSKKATIKEDRTGDLDAFGPQSVADYERLLLGQPNSAEMWVRYMIFQRELNEIEKARQIARRALATINPREEREKLDVWTALLHLENDFSNNDDAMDAVFKEACQHNDSREIHERMIKIYISSGKIDKADTLYQSMTKNKSFTPDPNFWLGYATFLMDVVSPPSPARARALLQRATQSVPSNQHRHLTQKFAALEFKSSNGDAERGRTIFEGLISTWPKKGDVWDVYLSLEMSHGSEENIRDLFERMSKVGKKKRAATVFKNWAEWEGSVGNKKGVERVKAIEQQWKEQKESKEDE